MAKHQIIYTSCMRGIDGVNDGQQVFSYDESFSDSKTEDVKALFTYQVPSLPAGTLMSEEIAKTMPASFMYRLLRNGSVAVTLNTYLGRDYMGSAGRFGNHLSHSIVCDFSELNVYPSEMYASTALRNCMEFEEVNNPNPPAHLPTPEMTKGYVVDSESIIEFLGIGDNLEYYKKMVAAMLRFPTEKRRVVICDETENVIKWIAALHYTMPLDMAKKVNFTTYEYDPELSSAQICGVIAEGSRYNAAAYVVSNRHYVFDFLNNQFSKIETESVFMDFLDTAFSFSYESLTEFHDFVIAKTTYRECGQGYYAAYYLYNLLTQGIADITRDEFEEVMDFASEFLADNTQKELMERLICETENINRLDNEYALIVLGFMLKSIRILNMDRQNDIKQMIVDRLILSLSTEGMSEDLFVPLYDSIDKMAREVRLSIPAELMVERNRDSLLGVLEHYVEAWKVLFIVRMISEYVKDTCLAVDQLYPDCAIGKIYFGIVRLMYSSGRQNGYEIVEYILASFQDNAVYYVNMALNMEGFLKDLELKDSDITHLWEYFYDMMVLMDMSSIEAVNKILREYDRFDEMYRLYDKQIRGKASFEETRDFFAEYWSKWFVKDPEYGRAYAAHALEEYESLYRHRTNGLSDKELFTYAVEILHLAMGMQIKEDYVDALCQAICQFMPLEKPNAENLRLIKDIYKYQTETMKRPIGGSLLLFWIALQFGKITKKVDIIPTAQSIKSVEPEQDGARFECMTDGKIKDYFEWAFDSVNNFSLLSDDYAAIYDLFIFDRQTQKLFMEYWCKMSYKKSKGDKDYADFAEFLTFMFGIGSLDDQDMVGKYVCKLSRQKLENLDIEMRDIFRRDRKAAHAWKNIKDIAGSTNPLFNNLSGLFKKK